MTEEITNQEILSLDDIYFKDAFTKTEDKLNLEVNNANIDCMTSRNNKFSLDSDGNLVVKSITSDNINIQNIFDAIYPIGSIYTLNTNTNPSTLFGGTWQQIKDRFLLCAGDLYELGATGGEATHTLTVNEMPTHKHDMEDAIFGGNVNKLGVRGDNGGSNHWIPQYSQKNGYSSYRPANTGGSQPHNNMPPYQVVYAWERIS